MVFSSSNPGLLPTPNSPKIISKSMKDYIHPSFYPIPFQAVNIVESLNINCPPTWDLNVTSKNIKFKAEWDLSGNVIVKDNGNCRNARMPL